MTNGKAAFHNPAMPKLKPAPRGVAHMQPKTAFRKRVSRNLRAARLAMNPEMTQEAVGQLFRPPIARAAVALWEANDYGTVPTIENLAILARAYGRSLDELVFGSSTEIALTRPKKRRSRTS